MTQQAALAHPSTSSPAAQRGSSSLGLLVGAGLLLVLGIAATAMVQRHLDSFLGELDSAALRQASESLDSLVDQQRARLIATVRVLSDDTRIRSTAMTGFDEGTIRDVLDDLKKASGVNVLAVLDERGKVRAVTGAEGLRAMDLSSSPVIKTALERPASYLWTLPEQVLIIGVAPIRAGPRVSALLLMGVALGTEQLTAIQNTLGVSAAVFAGDRLISSVSSEPALVEAFRSANELTDGHPHLLRGHPELLGRVSRTNDAATAAKIAWVVRRNRFSEHAAALRMMIWAPSCLLAAMFGLTLFLVRKRNGGTS